MRLHSDNAFQLSLDFSTISVSDGVLVEDLSTPSFCFSGLLNPFHTIMFASFLILSSRALQPWSTELGC